MKQLLKGGGLLRSAALACVAGFALSSFAGFDMTNPVTGETESYTYKYVGTGDWTVNDWQDSSDPAANPSAVPQAANSNLWDPLLIDGDVDVTAPEHVEGWSFRIGLFGDATLTIPYIRYWNGTAYAVVDSGSKLTIKSINTQNNWNATVNYYVAAQGGITYECAFNPTATAAAIYNYNLKGDGSVVYEDAVSSGSHVIKMADVTLSGSATPSVESKTLVSFASTTQTFTAEADIKVKNSSGDVLETLLLTSVTSGETTTLTGSEDVGTCELVQTSTGIVLYYVDGDPDAIVAKTYKPSININFTSGTALSTAADVGYVDYAVPGTSWNNLIGNNGTLSTVTQVDSTGAASTVAGVGVTISGTRGYWTCGSVSAATDLRQGYIDDADGANASPQVVVSGIPYYSYYAVVYFSNHDANVPFGYVTINGTNYKWDSENSELVECEGTSSDSWGASSPTAWTEGGNYIVTPTIVNSDGNFTIVSHRLSSSIRSGIAAIQIVEVPKQAADGELVINVSGDTPYTVSENATYTTVYVTGAGTLAFSGEGTITTTTLNVGAGATVPMGSSITPTTVTGSGTIVYDGAQPSTTAGFDDSESWYGTVWVKNVGDTTKGEAEGAKVTTCLGSNTTDATSNDLNKWGNANSFVKFTNVRAYMAKADVPWTLILEDDATNYAWYNNEGWTARSITIAGLKGDGTFWDINDGGCRPFLNFGDASQFTGTIKALGKQVFLNDTTNTGDATSGLAGRITVPAGQTLTVPSDKTWHTRNGLVVNGTLNANGTLASESTTAAVSGSGTVVFAGKMPSPTTDVWWKNAAWTGTVQIKSAAFTGVSGVDTYLDVNKYGNDGSVLELNNCSGWLPVGNTSGDNVCAVPLKVTGTLTINDGYSNRKFTINKLLGDGAIYTTSNGATVTIQVLSADDFAGYVQLNSKRVIFGETIPETFTSGQIYVGEGFTFTVPNSGVAWFGTGGITLAGELKAAALSNFGGGTNITTSDNGVFTLTSTGNGTEGETDTDYARIKGTGSLKYEGTGWRALTTNNLSTAVTLVNEQSGDILLSRALTYTVGSLSGSKNFQGNYGSGNRYLNVIQSKDTEWSGKVVNDNSSRFAGLKLDASSTGTLTLSGTASQNVALEVNGGAVNLTGTWVGATTVAGTFGGTGTLTGDLTFSDGATFKAFTTDEDGLAVSGTVAYPETGTVTVDFAEVPTVDTVLITASGLDADKFALAEGTDGSLKVEGNTLVYVAVGGGYDGGDGSTFTIAADVVEELTSKLPEGVSSLSETVEGKTFTYAQAYALGLVTIGEESLEVADLTATIAIVDGAVKVSIGSTPVAGYTVTCYVYEKASLEESDWPDEATYTYAVGSEAEIEQSETGAGFFQVKVTISNTVPTVTVDGDPLNTNPESGDGEDQA